ncbi:GTP-binding protein Rit1 isoform X2 [Lepidochelys kempii]|uniref:GTP-binding protein Rit1 isoform X2 n=1 Tax=Lepidochelys kempii TaxID=8472 RepID=UPI003C7051F6
MDSGARQGGGALGQSREYKLVMLGAGGVGKSAMTMQFISHRFPEDHDPTIEDAYKIRIRIDDEPANLDILDTAGQAEFTAMRDQYMRAGEGFIICYSITDRRSFHEVREFKQLIYRVRRTDDTPVVLVGNKSDLTLLRQVPKTVNRKYCGWGLRNKQKVCSMLITSGGCSLLAGGLEGVCGICASSSSDVSNIYHMCVIHCHPSPRGEILCVM